MLAISAEAREMTMMKTPPTTQDCTDAGPPAEAVASVAKSQPEPMMPPDG